MNLVSWSTFKCLFVKAMLYALCLKRKMLQKMFAPMVSVKSPRWFEERVIPRKTTAW